MDKFDRIWCSQNIRKTIGMVLSVIYFLVTFIILFAIGGIAFEILDLLNYADPSSLAIFFKIAAFVTILIIGTTNMFSSIIIINGIFASPDNEKMKEKVKNEYKPEEIEYSNATIKWLIKE